VISHNPALNQIVVDAGALALSKDRSTAAGPGPDMGYGLVLDLLGRCLASDLMIIDVHQEHGEIGRTLGYLSNTYPSVQRCVSYLITSA